VESDWRLKLYADNRPKSKKEADCKIKTGQSFASASCMLFYFDDLFAVLVKMPG